MTTSEPLAVINKHFTEETSRNLFKGIYSSDMLMGYLEDDGVTYELGQTPMTDSDGIESGELSPVGLKIQCAIESIKGARYHVARILNTPMYDTKGNFVAVDGVDFFAFTDDLKRVRIESKEEEKPTVVEDSAPTENEVIDKPVTAPAKTATKKQSQ